MYVVQLPEILLLPDKLLPLITEFNNYKFFVVEGGRGSGKTQSIARLILFLADQKTCRVICGREIQATLDDSVHATFSDLIRDYHLAFDVLKNGITHKRTESSIKFKGFRDQGSVNIKGLEGVDVVWVDEAQSVSKQTLDMLIPTIRKEECKIIFTLNRHTHDDPVMSYVNRDDCLHIKINYFENQYCPNTLKIEAADCKARSERDYNHIWLGEPLNQTDDYLFDNETLNKSLYVNGQGWASAHQRVIGIDFAAGGNDTCVAAVLDRVDSQTWRLADRVRWQETNSNISIGRIVDIIGKFSPDICLLDVGGMGHVVYNCLQEIGIKVIRFDGASVMNVDTVNYFNARAEGYYLLKEWFEKGWMSLKQEDKEVIKELEKIKMKYRSNGKKSLEPKIEMKAQLGYSPDNADALMMAVFGAVKFLGNKSNMMLNSGINISGRNNVPQYRRITGTSWKKR